MAYLIHGTNRPVVYCANYRVGSTATGMALKEMGCTMLGLHHDIPDKKDIPPNALVVETTRHHCDVLASWWTWRKTTSPFSEFIQLVLNGEHGALDANQFYGKFPTNYYLEYNTLEYEWKNLCLIAGLDYQPLPRTPSKRAKSLKWSLLFTPDLRRLVYGRYGDEMRKFGYGSDQPLG